MDSKKSEKQVTAFLKLYSKIHSSFWLLNVYIKIWSPNHNQMAMVEIS